MRRRFSYANVVATLALVFAMSGGALAANHYLIKSTKQISPKVLKKLKVKGKTGKAGKTGTPGATGAAGSIGSNGTAGAQGAIGVPGRPGFRGAEGEKGPPGATGPQGPAAVESLAESFVQIGPLSPSILLDATEPGKMVLSTHFDSGGEGKDLSLGAYALVLVQATVQVHVEAGQAEVTCQLADKGLGEGQVEELYGQTSKVDIPAGAYAEVPLTGATKLAGPEEYDLRVYCTSLGATASATGGSLNAVGYETQSQSD
jgi:hypothetical protein